MQCFAFVPFYSFIVFVCCRFGIFLFKQLITLLCKVFSLVKTNKQHTQTINTCNNSSAFSGPGVPASNSATGDHPLQHMRGMKQALGSKTQLLASLTRTQSASSMSRIRHIYIYIYIYIYTYIHTNKQTYIHTYIHTFFALPSDFCRR